MKILYVTTISNTVNAFLIPHIRMLIEQNHKVDVAFCVERNVDPEIIKMGCKIHDLQFQRNPLSIKNFDAYMKLKRLIKEENYELIHTHTPVASACVRLACRGLKSVKVFYTAHGFHFYKGSPLKNWLIYYPIEKWLSRYTDCLITINREDYNTAIDHKFRAGRIELVNGVGIDLTKFKPQDKNTKEKLRKEYGFSNQDFILVYVGELSYRKHQDLLISVVQQLKDIIPNIKLLLVGDGPFYDQYKKQIVDAGVVDNVKLLGYKKDIPNLMVLSDLAVSSSRREGLPVNIMEAMAVGLPLVVTDCRGNRDLVKNNENGFVVPLDDVDIFVESIVRIYNSDFLKKSFRSKNLDLINDYSQILIADKLRDVYLNSGIIGVHNDT